ncbi:hypothetical protein ACFQRK_00830 [Parapedobacter sp. GCM10030251]|uniref:hypothetical protein n=1 Tax=Parapedobacter sp. GCM10030251 TaxID=3273419 RepID=UPI00361156BE
MLRKKQVQEKIEKQIYLRVKSMKLNREMALLPTFYQGDDKEQGNHGNEENANDIMGCRMLENLKMALLFSRIQSQVEDDHHGEH